MFIQCASSWVSISAQSRRDSSAFASTSGSEMMTRSIFRKGGRLKIGCSVTGRLAGFDDLTLLQPSDNVLELNHSTGEGQVHGRSLLLSHHVSGRFAEDAYISHSHEPWESHYTPADDQLDHGSTNPDHRLQPWSSNPRHISAILLRTHSLIRLERILDQHSPFLNARHISIALSFLPDIAGGSRKVSGSQSSQNDSSPSHSAQTHLTSASQARAKRVRVLSLASSLASSFGRHLSEYEPRDFAGAARALGKIECPPPGVDGGRQWIEGLLSASLCGEGLEKFQSRELATFLWGLARIQLKSSSDGGSCLPSFSSGVGLEWIMKAKGRALEIAKETEEALTSSPQRWQGLGGSVATPQGLSVILWSLSILSQGKDTSGSPCESDEVSSEAEEACDELTGSLQDESPLLPGPWIDEYLSVLSNPTVIRSLDSKNVCMSMVALARCSLGSSYRPTPASVHRLLHRLLSQRSSSAGSDDPRCIVEALWALAKLGFRPGRDVMSRLCHASKALLVAGRMSGKGAVILIWSLAVLKVEPEQLDDSWLMEYEQSTMNLIGSEVTSQGLSLMVWAMARLGFRPGFAWMDAVITASQDKMSELGDHSLSLLSSSLVTLKVNPRPSWTLALIAAATRALPHASPLSVTLMAYSIAKLAGTFFGKHGRASSPSSSSPSFLRPSQKAICAAFVEVVVTKSVRVLRRQQREGSILPPDLHLSSGSVAILMWSIAKISHTACGPKGSAVVSTAWLSAASAVSSELMPVASARDASQVLYAAARLSRGYSPLSPMVDVAVRRLSWIVRHEPHKVNLQDISNSLWALASLRHMPPHASTLLDTDLIALLSAAQESIQMASCPLHDREIAQITWSLIRLTAYEPSLLQHPQLSSLMAALLLASQTLFDSVTGEATCQHVSLLSLWTLIAGLSRLVFLSNSPLAPDGVTRSSSQPLELSQMWIRAATDAAAIVVSSSRSLSVPPRQRRRMNDGIVLALQELGALPGGDEGMPAWRDCVRSVASRGMVGDWEEPFLKGPAASSFGSSQDSSVVVSHQERSLMLRRQMLSMGVNDDSSDEEHRW